MLIPIEKSEYMDSQTDGDIPETKMIRIPTDLRQAMGVKLYTFLKLRTRFGDPISLVVGRAYKTDAERNAKTAYVTSATFDLLSDAAEHDIDVCEDVVLGCDPELVIINSDNNAVVDAHKIFRKWNSVGSDGLLLELRPQPSTEENVVTGNLFLQLLEARRILSTGKLLYGGYFNGDKCVIRARSYYSPAGAALGGLYIGFHIHFGLPRPLLSRESHGILRNIAALLDYYVGIPAILIEGEHDNIRRSQTKIAYGKPSDWRRGAGNVTMEYRVPGGALMKTPETAMGILGIAGFVMRDIVHRIRLVSRDFQSLADVSDREHLREIYPTVPAEKDVFLTICSPSIKPAKEMLPKIYSDYEKMIGFDKRKPLIDLFLKLVLNPYQISEYVEQNWRNFYEQKQQGSVDVSSR